MKDKDIEGPISTMKSWATLEAENLLESVAKMIDGLSGTWPTIPSEAFADHDVLFNTPIAGYALVPVAEALTDNGYGDTFETVGDVAAAFNINRLKTQCGNVLEGRDAWCSLMFIIAGEFGNCNELDEVMLASQVRVIIDYLPNTEPGEVMTPQAPIISRQIGSCCNPA